MLTLDHFYVSDKKILFVTATGEESESFPVYFYNHGEPVQIGSIGEDSIRVFEDFIPEKKLEVLCEMLEHFGGNKLELGKIIWQKYLFQALKEASRDLEIDDTNEALECVKAWIDAHDSKKGIDK